MKNKKIKKFLIVLFIILGLIAIVSITIHILKMNYRKIYSVSNEIVKEEIYNNIFEEFVIDSTMCDINIKPSEDNNIKIVFSGDKDNIKIEEKNNKLYISIAEKNFIHLDFYKNIFKLDLYIPSRYSNLIRIENKYGNIAIDEFVNAEFEIENKYGNTEVFGSNYVFVDTDNGNIEIANSLKVRLELRNGDIKIEKVNGASIESEYSNILIEDISNYVKIKNKNGDIKLDELNILENSYIENKYGDITIKTNSEIYFNLNIKYGEKKIKNNYKNSELELKIQNKYGDVFINN